MNEDEILASIRKTLKEDYTDADLSKDDIKLLIHIIEKVSGKSVTRENFPHMVDMISYYIKGYQEAIKDSNEIRDSIRAYRTPRKVKVTALYGDCECPTCGFNLYTKGVNRYKCETSFCSRCGQALDWSEV